MNGDVVEYLVAYLERKEDELPENVDNGMVLVALRMVMKDVRDVKCMLIGEKPGQTDGVVKRLERVEQFIAAAKWVLSPIVLAILAGVGVFIWSELIK